MSARPGIRPAGEPSTVRPAASRWRGNTSGSDSRPSLGLLTARPFGGRFRPLQTDRRQGRAADHEPQRTHAQLDPDRSGRAGVDVPDGDRARRARRAWLILTLHRITPGILWGSITGSGLGACRVGIIAE
jgi:hypothetical protein